MEYRYFIYLFLMFLYSAKLSAQPTSPEKLFALINNTKDLFQKVRLLNQLADTLLKEKKNKLAFNHVNQALKIAQKVSFKAGLAESYRLVAKVHIQNFDYDKAIDFAEKEFSLRKELKQYEAQSDNLNFMGNAYWYLGQYDKAGELYQKALAINQKTKNQKALVRSYRYVADYYRQKTNYPKAITYYQKAIRLARKMRQYVEEGASYNNLAIIYSKIGNYDLELANYLKAKKLYELYQNPEELGYSYVSVGRFYIDRQKYNSALEYLKKGYEINQQTQEPRYLNYNFYELGRMHKGIKNYPKAKSYFKQSIELCIKLNEKRYWALNLREIGSIFQEENDLFQAKNHYLEALQLYTQIKDIAGIILCYNSLGDVYFSLRDYPQAENYLKKAMEIALQIGNKSDLVNTYLYLTKIYELRQDVDSALLFYKKHIALKDSIFNTQVANEIAQIQLNYENEKRNKAIQLLKKEKQIADFRRTALTWGLLLLFIISVLIISRQRLKNRKNRKIFEQNQKMLQAEKEISDLQLQSAQKELLAYIKNLLQKNELLEELRTEVETLKQQNSAEQPEAKIEQINRLTHQVILTEEQWQEFKLIFEQVYKGFLIKLKQNHPDLTTGEIRICALLKLQLHSKEMSVVLGISPASVNTARYRLRKKLSLSAEADLEKFIFDFS